MKKGQLLAVLENKDLAAQAEASKGDLDQANANSGITLDSGLPQQLQKAEFDAATAKAAFEAARSVYESRKDLYQQGAIPRRDMDSAEVALAQAEVKASRRKNNSPICVAWVRNNWRRRPRARKNQPKAITGRPQLN